MPKRKQSNAELLILLPWWVSVVLAVLAYVALRIVLPAVQTDNVVTNALFKSASPLAGYAAGGFLFLGLLSAIRSWVNGRMLDKQTGINSLRELPWKDFEDLVAEAYRRKGYSVEEMLGGGADGGIDLTLYRQGEKTLVQCKRWKGKPVPVNVVRELYGLLVAERAAQAILVTTSNYTSDAVAFAANKPITLIDGEGLAALVRTVQKQPLPNHADPEPRTPETPFAPTGKDLCPRCGAKMVLRTSRRGPQAGNQFWGCSSYPQCRGTRPA